ncbi:hypothetical protein EG68_00157 [Paragonimus skrjabini miyazakii]|uniref:Roundabout n=1 Tax=Paragonimus skrjabini miyazakii TaxID=59628 RepID=A0A8S9ZCV9_9TREM|nr:hypothetical protein EG68_00157 [Paragonimus skrjabini miyazakii]
MDTRIIRLTLNCLQLHAFVFCFSLCFSRSHQQNRPVIILAPKNHFSSNGVLEFTCQAEGVPLPKITWYNASTGQVVTDQIPDGDSLSGVHVNQYHGKLMISNPLRGRLYSFYCNASNKFGWTISQPPVLGGLAFLDDHFVQFPTNQTCNVDDRVQFDCQSPNGFPTPTIYWILNSVVIGYQNTQPLPARVQVLPNGSLTIHPVKPTDFGTYQCVATNVVGKQQSGIVYLSPTSTTSHFFEVPKSVRVRQGEDAKFSCEFDGTHPITWKRGNGEKPMDSLRATFSNTFLVIKGVQPSDSGTYVCSVSGLFEQSATLTVDTPPSFLQAPNDVTKRVGENALFECVATGQPQPSIYWELPDMTPVFPSELTSDSMQTKYFVHGGGHLEVKQVTVGDEGRYQCTAHSSVDTIHASAKLHVIQPSNTNDQKYADETAQLPAEEYSLFPFIGLPPSNQTVLVGAVVTLTCEKGAVQAEGPPLKNFVSPDHLNWIVSWDRMTVISGKVETNWLSLSHANQGRYRLLSGGSLQILQVQLNDSGLYTCVVSSLSRLTTNGIQTLRPVQSKWTASLQVTSKLYLENHEPALPPPSNLHVINMTSTTTILTWTPPTLNEMYDVDLDSLRIGYWAEYYRPDRPDDGWVVVESNWPMHIIHLRGLEANIIYYFLVRSRWINRKVGWASYPIGPLLTSGFGVKQAPRLRENFPFLLSDERKVQITNIELHPVSKSTVKLAWKVRGSKQASELLKDFTIHYREVSILQCIIENRLLSGINQKQTAPYCSFGTGLQIQLKELEVKLAHMQQLRGLNPNNYSVTPKILQGTYPSSDIQTTLNHPQVVDRSAFLYDLDPFSCYAVTLTFRSPKLDDQKQESRVGFTLTPESVPSASPTQLNARWTDRRHIQLNWVEPEVNDWNGLITGYLIFIFDESMQKREIINVSQSTSQTSFEVLMESAVYVIQMAAATCAGAGIASQPIQLYSVYNKVHQSSVNFQQSKDRHLNKDRFGIDLLDRPWFMGTMIGSIVAWFIIIGLMTAFCFRKRYQKRKQIKASLIPLDSVGASLNSHHFSTASLTKQNLIGSFIAKRNNCNIDLQSRSAAAGSSCDRDFGSGETSPCTQSKSYFEISFPSNELRGDSAELVDSPNPVDLSSTKSVLGNRTVSFCSSGERSVNSSICQIPRTRVMGGMEQVVHSQAAISVLSGRGTTAALIYPHNALPPFQPPFTPINNQTFQNLPSDVLMATGLHATKIDTTQNRVYSPFQGSGLSENMTNATPYATASIIPDTVPGPQTNHLAQLSMQSTCVPIQQSNLCMGTNQFTKCDYYGSSSEHNSHTSSADQTLTTHIHRNRLLEGSHGLEITDRRPVTKFRVQSQPFNKRLTKNDWRRCHTQSNQQFKCNSSCKHNVKLKSPKRDESVYHSNHQPVNASMQVQAENFGNEIRFFHGDLIPPPPENAPPPRSCEGGNVRSTVLT